VLGCADSSKPIFFSILLLPVVFLFSLSAKIYAFIGSSCAFSSSYSYDVGIKSFLPNLFDDFYSLALMLLFGESVISF
jgi:hypothetical protein